jgi:hypothetical protein
MLTVAARVGRLLLPADSEAEIEADHAVVVVRLLALHGIGKKMKQ